LSINTYNSLGRQFYLDKIQSEIETLENEFLQNTDELDQIHDSILDIKPGTRNKENDVWYTLNRRRIKLSQRNTLIQKKLINLHQEYFKYQKIEM
jgi:hypothetical protein